jgi:hypothetical protein
VDLIDWLSLSVAGWWIPVRVGLGVGHLILGRMGNLILALFLEGAKAFACRRLAPHQLPDRQTALFSILVLNRVLEWRNGILLLFTSKRTI